MSESQRPDIEPLTFEERGHLLNQMPYFPGQQADNVIAEVEHILAARLAQFAALADNFEPKPPTPKYRLTVVIEGNSHDEIERELLSMTRGGYLLSTNYHKRDECHVVGGRRSVTLTHQNPDMTAERYSDELDAWWQARKEARRG